MTHSNLSITYNTLKDKYQSLMNDITMLKEICRDQSYSDSTRINAVCKIKELKNDLSEISINLKKIKSDIRTYQQVYNKIYNAVKCIVDTFPLIGGFKIRVDDDIRSSSIDYMPQFITNIITDNKNKHVRILMTSADSKIDGKTIRDIIYDKYLINISCDGFVSFHASESDLKSALNFISKYKIDIFNVVNRYPDLFEYSDEYVK